MSFFPKVIVAFVFLLLLGICSATFLIFEDAPAVVNEGPIQPARLQQTLSFIEAADPRTLPPGTETNLTLREEDMDLLLNYMLNSSGHGVGKVSINEEVITVAGSVKVPSTFFDRYLNLQFILTSDNESLKAGSVKLGKLELPGVLTRMAAKLFNRELIRRVPDYVEISDAITGYKIIDRNLVISYRWHPELLRRLSDRGSGLLIDDDEKEKLKLYTLKLAELAADGELQRSVSLARIFEPVFALAQSRGGDPVKENRAAIIAMALYVMDIDLAQVSADARSIPEIERRNITLRGRLDFAKHFLTSAALTLSVNTDIADSFGLIKEIDDATAGSGFSFTDVGADRAGVRFAEFAISSPQNALVLQRRLSADLAEGIFIPNLADLPEFMPEQVFVAEYGGINQPEFQRVIADIEERISELPLYAPE